MPTGNFNCGPNVCVCACQSGGCICRDTLLGERDASEKWRTPFLRNSLLKWYSPRVDVVFYSLSVLLDLLCKVFGGSCARARHSHPLRLRGSVHITISSVCVHFLPNAPQWCMKIKIKKHCLRYVEHMCRQGYLTGSKAILEFHKLTIHSFWPVSLLLLQNKTKNLAPTRVIIVTVSVRP